MQTENKGRIPVARGTFITFVGLALYSATAMAQQNVVQSDSQWYTDAQATLQNNLARQPIMGTAKNVILLIADGNGIATNYAIRLFDGQQNGMFGEENVLPHEAFPYLALVKTYNINAQTPDSAPTAAAMNTGVKQVFNTLNLNENAIHEDCTSEAGNELTLFSEMVSDMGKSVGIVTTTRLTHATPGAVYAKTANRNWEHSVPEGCDGSRDIALQLFDAMEAGTVDLAMGGGRREFLPEGVVAEEETEGRRGDGRNLVEELTTAGAQYAWNTETANALNLDGSTPILALFEDSHMKYEYDRTDEEEPSLADMTRMAIEYLSQNEDGYYLEVEAGRVDHANHAGNLHRTLTDGVAFAEAIATADEMTDDEDTLIVVTADHSHALIFNGYCGRGSPITGLCMGVAKGQVGHSGEPELAADGKPYTVAGYLNGAGSVLIEQGDGSYFGTRPVVDQETATDPEYLQQALVPRSSETHSGEDVAVYAKGPWAHLFDGTVEQNYIFHVMNHAVTAE
jgi:alkaline phosphatase